MTERNRENAFAGASLAASLVLGLTACSDGGVCLGDCTEPTITVAPETTPVVELPATSEQVSNAMPQDIVHTLGNGATLVFSYEQDSDWPAVRLSLVTSEDTEPFALRNGKIIGRDHNTVLAKLACDGELFLLAVSYDGLYSLDAEATEAKYREPHSVCQDGRMDPADMGTLFGGKPLDEIVTINFG